MTLRYLFRGNKVIFSKMQVQYLYTYEIIELELRLIEQMNSNILLIFIPQLLMFLVRNQDRFENQSNLKVVIMVTVGIHSSTGCRFKKNQLEKKTRKGMYCSRLIWRSLVFHFLNVYDLVVVAHFPLENCILNVNICRCIKT